MLLDDGPKRPKRVGVILRKDILNMNCSILCFNKRCICWKSSFVLIKMHGKTTIKVTVYSLGLRCCWWSVCCSVLWNGYLCTDYDFVCWKLFCIWTSTVFKLILLQSSAKASCPVYWCMKQQRCADLVNAVSVQCGQLQLIQVGECMI